MVRGLLVTCTAVVTAFALSLPAMSQTALAYDQSTATESTSMALDLGGSALKSDKSSSADDDSGKINWGLCLTGACAAVGAFAGLGSSGSGSAAVVVDEVDYPAMLIGDIGGGEEQAAAPAVVPAVPDAPSALLFVLGLPAIVRLVRRR